QRGRSNDQRGQDDGAPTRREAPRLGRRPGAVGFCLCPDFGLALGPWNVLVGGHGTNSTFDILSASPSLLTVTLSRQARGSLLPPAELVTSEVAATNITAESGVIDCTAVAFTVPAVTTLLSCTTLMKSSERAVKSSLNSPLEQSRMRCTSSLARLKSSDVRFT